MDIKRYIKKTIIKIKDRIDDKIVGTHHISNTNDYIVGIEKDKKGKLKFIYNSEMNRVGNIRTKRDK